MSAAPEGYQQKARRYQQYTDQHGRRWGAVIEIKTGHPCGPWEPKFDAPWLPATEYLRIRPDHEAQPWAVVIDYDTAIADLKEAKHRFDQLCIARGIELHGDRFDETAPVSNAVKQIVGNPPKPWEPYKACKDGNGYLLGFRPFDARQPGDVTLHALLAPVVRREEPTFGDQSFEDLEEPAAPVARKRAKE
jgi:hypothetical protein